MDPQSQKIDPPRTIATALERNQAKAVRDHLDGALKAGAKSIILYTTLNDVPEEPQAATDLPHPDLYVFEAVYVLGVATPIDELQAQVAENSGYIDSPKGEL